MSKFPVLRFGSIGEPVRTLQNVLNVAPTRLPRLDPDAQFGSKTHTRVLEFQGQQNLERDGVVGPLTWAQLEPFFNQLKQIVDQLGKPAAGDESWSERVVAAATAAFKTFGWGETGIPVPDGSPRIIAAKGFGPSAGGRRARQGGVALASIFSLAGAGGANCLTISSEMEEVYQWGPDKSADRRAKVNQNDIGSWCGVFAAYCLRSAGIPVSWEDVRSQSTQHFEKLLANAAVKRGDIVVMDKSLNHHSVVVQDSAPGARVYTIDGNVANPSESNVAPWNSVIARRFYLRNTLMSKSAVFLRPKTG